MTDINKGTLTVLKTYKSKFGLRYLIECTCGDVFVKMKSRFEYLSGKGCPNCRYVGEYNGNYRHGGNTKNKPEYNSYRAMKARCYDPNYRRYDRYGGRGITVCLEWKNKGGFINFLRDMGKKPTLKHTIDRIDNDGDYTPSNCRWATQREQLRNSSVTVLIEVDGYVDSVVNQCRKHGISRNLYENRVKLGWDIVKIFNTPTKGLGSNYATFK